MTKKLSEQRQPIIHKLLLASIGAWMTGKYTTASIRGDRNTISAISEAIASSNRLSETLSDSEASLDSVSECIRLKNEAAQNFYEVCGVRWPL